MFDWNFLVFLWILCAAFCAGLGWKIGEWVGNSIINRNKEG